VFKTASKTWNVVFVYLAFWPMSAGLPQKMEIREVGDQSVNKKLVREVMERSGNFILGLGKLISN
jgi:hypothetical protein